MLNSKKAKVWSVLLAVVACIIVGICLVNHFKDTKKDSAKSNENTKLEDKSGEEFNLDKSSIESENEGENVVLLDGMYEGTPYDEFNVPRLVIQTSDQTFQFSYDAFMSYLPMGSYEIKDSKVYECPYCGLKIDRDYNAAINILRYGLTH